MISTREANPGDARAVAIAHIAAWRSAYAGIFPSEFLDSLDVDTRTEDWFRNFTETSLADETPAPHNFVAVVDDCVVGFSCVGVWRETPDDPKLAEVWAIYAHPEHWGTGVGRALMARTVDHLTDLGVEVAYLWVLEDNHLARRFYERQGWQADDSTKSDVLAGTTVVERRYSRRLPRTRE